MTKEEIWSKINLLKAFCAQNGISVDELFELSSHMTRIENGSPFDIYYEDGEITRRIDLIKNPIAFKIFSLLDKRELWVSTLVLNKADFAETQVYLESLPKISSHSWRIPDTNEIPLLLENNFEYLSNLRHIFDLPDFMEADVDYEEGFFGCFDDDHKLYGALYFNRKGILDYFPGAYASNVSLTDKLNWWPVCDAD